MTKFTITPIMLVVVLACMTVGTNALSESLTSALTWYDDFALYNIWKAMMYFVFNKYLMAYVCGTQATVLAVMTGFFTATEIEAGMDTKEICLEGVMLIYEAVWYRNGDKFYTYGDNDMFNYTI